MDKNTQNPSPKAPAPADLDPTEKLQHQAMLMQKRFARDGMESPAANIQNMPPAAALPLQQQQPAATDRNLVQGQLENTSTLFGQSDNVRLQNSATNKPLQQNNPVYDEQKVKELINRKVDEPAQAKQPNVEQVTNVPTQQPSAVQQSPVQQPQVTQPVTMQPQPQAVNQPTTFNDPYAMLKAAQDRVQAETQAQEQQANSAPPVSNIPQQPVIPQGDGLEDIIQNLSPAERDALLQELSGQPKGQPATQQQGQRPQNIDQLADRTVNFFTRVDDILDLLRNNPRVWIVVVIFSIVLYLITLFVF